MSRITDLGNKLEHLPNILTEYDNIINEAKDNIIIKGKTLETANRENPSWHGYYDTKRVELTILVKHMEAQVAKVRSELFRSLSDYNQREMSDNAKNKYIDSEERFLSMYGSLLEVKEVSDKMEAICKAFQTRGYALNNITKVVVAEATEYTI